MMATTASIIRGQISGTQLTRTLERVLEDAQLTGELRLSGRKLKEFPKVSSKYNLSDTVVADLSKNRFAELPLEVCDFICVEKMDCYNNVIRNIPDAVIRLQSLTHLNLSRNHLTVLPEALCKLNSLQVLIVSNNKLVSLPEEIGRLDKLMELDVSCNEISYLPPNIEELENLRSLNIRRNLLVEIPNEIAHLRLIKLDISGNRISTLPTELRLMDCLIDLLLHNNPMTSPPSYLCTRGRVHIFKYLEIQAIKDDKRKGILDSELQQPARNKFDAKLHNLPLDKRKRCTMDSGYNTSEGSDKRWSQELPDLTPDLDEQNLALRSAEQTKEQRHKREKDRHLKVIHPDLIHNFEGSLSLNGKLPPDLVSPYHKRPIIESNLEDEIKKDMPIQRLDYDERMKLDEWKRTDIKESFDEEQWKNNRRIYEVEKESLTRMISNRSSSTSLFSGLSSSEVDANPFWNADCDIPPESPKTFPHIQTYREYKEAKRQQRAAENSTTYRRPMAEGELSLSLSSANEMRNFSQHTVPDGIVANHVTASEHPVNGVLSSGVSATVGSSPRSNTGPSISSSSVSSSSLPSKNIEFFNSSFTIRREFQKAKEEAELIQQLRQAIETRLKVSLPDDISSALMDGVVLCHLANHVRPRSVASIHVPSPAVPKLTMAKCRKNVENFLDACRSIGIDEDYICSPQDILEEKSAACIAITVEELLKFNSPVHPKHAT